MFRRKIPSKKYFALTSMLVLVGFFACTLHINPRSLYGIIEANTEYSNNQVVCVDHQGAIYSCSREQEYIMLVTTILPSIIEITSLTPIVTIFDSYTILYDPPDKIPRYIKNNTFLI